MWHGNPCFPLYCAKTGALVFLSVLLRLTIWWLIRIRFANAYQRTRPVVGASEPSLSVG